MKRLIIVTVVLSALILGGLSFGSTGGSSGTVYACSPAAGTCKASCKPASFFGLIPWYQFLQLSESGTDCNVDFQLLPDGGKASSLPLVLLAVLEDLVRIAGLVAVAYVIYGGVKYITSQGSPDQTKQAQQTIINALIGLTIAVIATGFVAFLGKTLGS